MINPNLLQLARERIAQQKQAFVATQPDPGSQLGTPTSQQSPGMAQPGGPQMGGTPPQQGMPPGGMPPGMDPSMMGGMPPGAGGMPQNMPPGMPPMQPPQAQPQGQTGSGKPKFDPLQLEHRMYNMQQQVTALLNALGVTIPPGALVMPPGTMGPPPAEHALPGGPMDPTQQAQQAQQQSGLGSIEGIQGAGQIQGSPIQNAMAASGKQAGWFIDQIDAPIMDWDLSSELYTPPPAPAPVETKFANQAAAIATLFQRNRQVA